MNSPTLPHGFTHAMKIGGGAFGAVYRARQTSLDRWVALKIIAESHGLKRTELLKEATTQARIHIECIPQVYDAFEWKGAVIIVMQWIKGASLLEMLRRQLSEPERLSLADGFIRALARLHESGYAHRDLKPANVVVSPADGVFLVDFSFTKKTDDKQKSMSGIVKGTPAYMAPEVWRGSSDIDYMSADMYSAGVILRELLAGLEAAGMCDALTQENPAGRPANAAELRAYWENRFHGAYSCSGLAQFVGLASSELHTHKLYAAAQELLRRDRFDEAYWLLVECLEENPNFAGALELMNRFGAITRRRTIMRYAAFAAAAGIAIIFAAILFFAINQSRQDRTMALDSVRMPLRREVVRLEIRRGEKEISPDGNPMMHGAPGHQLLNGRIFFAEFPDKGALQIDGKSYEQPSSGMHEIAVSFGMHTLAWVIDGTGIVWRERIFVLPFQQKGVYVNVRR